MIASEAVMQVIDALNAMSASYMVTGSLATNTYIPPRSTLAADFVVDMASEKIEQLFRRLSADSVQEPQMAFETVTGKTQHRFRHRGSQFLIEIFEAKMDDPHEAARFERRRTGAVEGRQASVPSAEDIVIQKLRWFKQIRRAKDREDVRLVMAHQWRALDWLYVERWCREHGTLDLLNEIKAEVQPLVGE